MNGMRYLNGWDVLLFLAALVSYLVLAVAVPTSVIGLVCWAVQRVFPRSLFVRTCMVLSVVIPLLWLAGITIPKWVETWDDVSVETTGRQCGTSHRMPRICVDTHLCAAVPTSYSERLTGCSADCQDPPCPCPRTILRSAAVLLEDESYWLIWAEQSAPTGPREDSTEHVFLRAWDSLDSPTVVDTMPYSVVYRLLQDRQVEYKNSTWELVEVHGPPDLWICADYLDDPGPVSYAVDAR
jgi:hypothetical protein